MKKLFLLVWGLVFATTSLFAAAGIFDSFAIVNGTFYDLDANTANADFQSASLGAFAPNGSLLLGGQLKSFKNNGTDVTGAAIFYVIFPAGNRPTDPSLTGISYAFQFDNVGGTNGDQQWGTDLSGNNTTNGALNILQGTSLANGTYTLEVYARITTNGVNANGEIFDSNNNLNYSATFTIDSALPVHLTHFTGRAKAAYNELSWATANEETNEYFGVERSSDARRWESIGRVAGQGSTESAQYYQFQDASPLIGTSYYRLRQVDYDGRFDYYGPVAIRRQAVAGEVQLFPNPAKGQLFVQLPEASTRGHLQLRNMLGQIQREWTARPGSTQGLALDHLPAGIYLLQWLSGDSAQPELLFNSRVVLE